MNDCTENRKAAVKEREQHLREKQISSKEVYRGVLLHAFHDEIELPNGGTSVREYLRHHGAVCIVPLTDDGKVVMEYQYRYPVHRVVREIPAGKLDSPDEDALEAAKRELQEETGLTADHWENLGDYTPAPAYSSEFVTMFLATGLHKGERHLDEGEFLDVYEEPIQTLVEDILAGDITDGKTQAAILKVYCKMQARQDA